jgi:hypothetical protein
MKLTSLMVFATITKIFELWLHCTYEYIFINIHIQKNVANIYAVWTPNSNFMKTYFSTILTNCSLCSWEALGEGKPSWWMACCSQRQRLSQCFLFIASKMSDRCSKTDLGDSPPITRFDHCQHINGDSLQHDKMQNFIHNVTSVKNFRQPSICAGRSTTLPQNTWDF